MLICKDYDNAIRHKTSERLDHLYEQTCDRVVESPGGNHPAVVTDDLVLSFRELDERANQVARFLLKQGITSGDRVGLLFDRSYQTYLALLAVLKINAAYVPLDADFPLARLDFIIKDAEVRAVLTLAELESTLRGIATKVILLDRARDSICRESKTRLSAREKRPPASQLCYIIYTSGSTGNPKGVAVEHPSICNFVKVAAEVYGYTPSDRVYQGMTIAFDFSVEELWVPLIAGATLIPASSRTNLVGSDLAAYLRQKRVTALCCVPTLLATIDDELPALRLLIVSGEACPPDLVARWHRQGRTVLNVYGPTEATVTCTWARLRPDRAVTIGQPLPTYSVVILHPERDEELANGLPGEICVAGIGLAKGYVNRDDLTGIAFIDDFLNLPNNPSKRIYRTGDLGRLTTDGEVEYHGRIDSQVKVRGYRIELTEVESVLLRIPQVAQAVVSTHTPENGAPELVAYYTLKDGAPDLSREKVLQTMRTSLPSYMLPAYLEKVVTIPMLCSNKVDRKRLPRPAGPRLACGRKNYVAPSRESEKLIAGVLAKLIQTDRVSVEDHFFDDLGLHSLLVARFGAALRERLRCSGVSMRDIYMHPTVAQLAAHLYTQPTSTHTAQPAPEHRIPTSVEYYTCGTLQLLYYGACFFFGVWALVTVVPWTLAAEGGLDLFARVTGLVTAGFFVWTTLSIAAKWVLVGTWKREKIPIWSLKYFRFWVVKQLIETSPIAVFRGYPIYNLYLRLLGAKIGKNVVMHTRTTPICTDLLRIGDEAILREDSILVTHKASQNYIHTGPITLGDNVVVGEGSVIDMDTVMEDDSQLGHASSLHEKQVVPKRKRYHGSPARVTTSNYRFRDQENVSTLRRVVFSAVQLAGGFAATGLLLCFLYYAVVLFARPVNEPLSIAWAGELLPIALGLFVGVCAIRFLLVTLVPRLLNLLLEEDKVYVRYGFHFSVFRLVRCLSNSTLFNLIFGDSSYIVHYLKAVGYRFSKVVQTGTNFGLVQKHDNPFLTHIGSRTIISDGLWFLNAQVSSTAFRLKKTTIGAGNFIGNNVYYPPTGRTGDNCFVATKALVPIDGKTRENVVLLGSPSFEIRRPTDDATEVETAAARQRGLGKKNAHNLRTMAALMLVGFSYFYCAVLLVYGASQTYGTFGIWAWTLVANALLFLSIAYCIAMERGSLGFRRLTPTVVSVYEQKYWRVERLWKYSETMLRWLWLGTPFRSVLSRLLGIKLGKKVFDDGMYVSEKTLVEIGDYCNLNESAVLQSHALEQSIYKSDHIRIGDRCSIGTNAFVHYGCNIGDDVVIGLDSFVMKGETVESGSRWRGNPAVCDLVQLPDVDYAVAKPPWRDATGAAGGAPRPRPTAMPAVSPQMASDGRTRLPGSPRRVEAVSPRRARSRRGGRTQALRHHGLAAVVGICMLSWTSLEIRETTQSPDQRVSSSFALRSPDPSPIAFRPPAVEPANVVLAINEETGAWVDSDETSAYAMPARVGRPAPVPLMVRDSTRTPLEPGPLPASREDDLRVAQRVITEQAAETLTAVASVDSDAPGAYSLDEESQARVERTDHPPVIDTLLKQAHRQWKVKRWTRPSGDNALETYHLVLNLEPENMAARQGILKLREAFLRQAETAMSRGDYSAGRLNYEKVLLVDPGYTRARIELARLAGKPRGKTVNLAAIRGKVQTFLASAEGDLRNFFKTVEFEGGRNSDVARPDR